MEEEFIELDKLKSKIYESKNKKTKEIREEICNY